VPRPATTTTPPRAPSTSNRPVIAVPSRRDEIRAAALRLFATVGYRATTMADIGASVGIRGPSIYKHVPSKQQLLSGIMTETMEQLLAAQRAAIASTPDLAEKIRRAVRAHVRYHALHRFEAFVGNREIDNLDEPTRTLVLDQRRGYETTLRRLVTSGQRSGIFRVPSARFASYALLDMGMGVSAWFDPSGTHSPEELADLYAAMALRMLDLSSG
jgi:AcrR family transcriptional regulator